MSSAFESLPSPLDEIAEIAGIEAAFEIAKMVAGTRVSIPARIPEQHWLVDAVGREKAETIASHFRTLSPENRLRGIEDIIIPLGAISIMKQAKGRFYAARDKGISVRAAARQERVHERTAFRWEAKRKQGDDPDREQLSLFSECQPEKVHSADK